MATDAERLWDFVAASANEGLAQSDLRLLDESDRAVFYCGAKAAFMIALKCPEEIQRYIDEIDALAHSVMPLMETKGKAK